jgi:NADH-quinone oxidoreductase subunit N
VQALPKNRGEVYILVGGVLLGLQLLVLSNHFLIMYLSLETASIGSYALVLYSMRRKSAEAAAKYVLFGVFSSAMMLYGISLVYGFSESLFFSDVLPQGVASPLLMIGIGLTLAGLLFKVAASPFHIWTPDVYEGAHISVVAFFSVVPKAAGFAVLLRLAHFFAMQDFFFIMLAMVALVSLLIGNLAALWQQGARRLMAYSSIAHAGFILAGVVGQATEAVFYYTAVYTFINLSAFAIIALTEQQTGSDAAESFAGIGRKDFLLGLVLVIAMAALIGLPPTSGFMAKLLVFSALWDMWEAGVGLYVPLLFFAGLISTVVSAFFYLRLPYFAFFRKYPDSHAPEASLALRQKLILLLLVIPVILLFLIASRLMELV